MRKTVVDVVKVSQMNDINIDQGAIKKLQELSNEKEEIYFFRIFVTGGGCSGFQYGFEFDENNEEDDFIINIDKKLKVLVDSLSYQYISGSTLFYEKSLMGEFFTLTNPNAKNTCGCGSSFDI